MNENIKHEIANYLHQIISNAEYFKDNEELNTYANNIKNAAYSIDAIITDSTIEKKPINLNTNGIDIKQFSNLDILIVDDIKENIQIMENIFQTLDCNIRSAMSGEEAIDIIKSGYKPNIISMDMIMPGLNGSQTTKKIKSLGSKAYFMAVSALKNQSNEVVELFDSWIPKPFTTEHIIGALSGYIQKSKEDVQEEDYDFKLDISNELKEEILNLARAGALSQLKTLVFKLESSKSKEFLTSQLLKADLNSIIKSIVSS